jgi:apolipoprotein N-acyltransferase
MALAPLMVASSLAQSEGKGVLRVVFLGWLSGVVYFTGTLYWVVDTMATYGGLPWLVAALVGAMLVAYVAIFPALFAWLLGRAVGRLGVTGLWLAPFLWVATEWVRSSFGGGFPWVLLGTSQSRVTPVVQLASVTGVYGLSFLIALVNAAAAAVALSRRRVHFWGAAATAGLLLLVAVTGAVRVAHGTLLRAGTPLRVGLVQGDIEQGAKWNPSDRDPIMTRHLDLSRSVLAMNAQLVIWPESSTPFFFDAEPLLAEPVRMLARQSHTPFLIGTDEFERGAGPSTGSAQTLVTRPEPAAPDRLYNAAVLVGPDGRSQGTYRKMQLVPFGEFVPMKRLLFFVGPLVQSVSDFSPGVDPYVFDVNGHGVSVAICYESVYPWLARAFVQRGSQLLATVTNDAWFGRSSAAYQHFEQGALRAVEEGRFVVRAANTGISGAVDPYGRVVTSSALFEATSVVVDVRLLDGRTIYARAGDVVVWLSLAATMGLLLIGRRRPGGR